MICLNGPAGNFLCSLRLLGSSIRVLSSDSFERKLEGRDELRDVFDSAILMLESVAHFLVYVALIFLELADCVGLDLLDLVTLTLQLISKLCHEIILLVNAFILLLVNRLFNLGRLFCEVVEDFALFLHSRVLLSLQVGKVFVHLSTDWIELVVQGLDSSITLVC